jgi:hypothetical protein
MSIDEKEICAKCGREIPRSEQAYVYKDTVVCQLCYDHLLGAKEVSSASATGMEEKLKSKKLSKDLYVHSWVGAVILAVFLQIFGIFLIENSVAPRVGILLRLLGSILSIYAVVISCVLYYKMWTAIQDGHASISPGKAVGFLFIPLFNIYWAFCMFVGFAEDYNAFIERHSIDVKKLPVGVFLQYVILSLLVPFLLLLSPILAVLSIQGSTSNAIASIAMISFLLGIVSSIWLVVTYIRLVIKICDAINTL